MKLFNRGCEVEFFCAEEDWDVIPRPEPAIKSLPAWFRALPARMGKEPFSDSTAKRCMPLLDMMSAGWTIPLAGDVHVEVVDSGGGLRYASTFHKPLVSEHHPLQVSSERSPHPLANRPPMKWLNYWFIRVPSEFSLMFIQPAERFEKRFRCFPAIVDAPYAELEYVNFPFVMVDDGFRGRIEAGTPLVQVIPVRKDAFSRLAAFRRQTAAEAKATEKHRLRRGAHESHYRDSMRKGR